MPLHEPSGPASLPLELSVPTLEIHDQSTESGVLAEDAVGNDVARATQNTHKMTTRFKDDTRPPHRFTISCHPFAFSVSAALQEPQTFAQARKHSVWRAAMEEEYLALLQNHTLDLVPPPPAQNVVCCKWVYRIKQNVDDTIDRYNAHMVAKVFNQREGVDYSEAFSPIIKSVTIRTILSIVVSSQWPIRQLDVKNAFFHGHLTEERLGFSDSKADPSMFTLRGPTYFVYLLVYVDDIILTGTAGAPFHSIITALQREFAMKDLSHLHFFLGMEARTDGTGLYLTQSKYIHDILARTSMLECKPISSPVSSGSRLSLHDGDLFQDSSLYRSVVGSLQCLSLTRPDIAYAVNQALSHLFMAFLMLIGQRIVARSSTESEYKSLANATVEILWLQSILRELEVSQCHPSTLRCDNISAIYLTANPIFHARTNHIEIDYHFVREHFMRRQLSIRFINSDDQLADALIHGLSSSRFADIRSKFHVAKSPFGLRGSNRED
ncbi:hypothetical protein CRG98_045070 [Punica granatum]|uniref:Reverse transcriptase Ty1/copia-type domain-containing protein n=1 Tax=Punica granatum TaxID=22663 RepID=A0A2I0HSG3_PUNGR|nr:hypothetical protein CRG98_045070 [Punica granatum]